MSGRGIEHIASLNDPDIIEAVTWPSVPKRAARLFQFLRDNDNLVTVAGGMEHFVTGLDRSKLLHVARDGYGIDLPRYMFAVGWYEHGMLKQQQNRLKKD